MSSVATQTARAAQLLIDQANTAAKSLPTGVVNVQGYGAKGDGSDCSAAFATLSAYVNSLPDAVVVVFFPQGRYVYASGLNFTRQVRLVGYDATLEYTGTGIALKLGPDGLTDFTYMNHLIYEVEGLTFTGGATMTHGVYWNDHITQPRITRCRFHNFGNATGWGVWYQGENWDSLMEKCHFWANGNVARNFVKARDAGLPNTKFRAMGCFISNLSYPIQGIGFEINGNNPDFAHCTIEGFAPNIRLCRWAGDANISNCYFESAGSAGCIQFGDPADGIQPGAFIRGLVVRDIYCNIHNTDLGATGHFIQPSNPQAGIESAYVSNIELTNCNREAVKLNNLSSQVGNQAFNIQGATGTNTAGALVTTWGGFKQHLSAEFTWDPPSVAANGFFADIFALTGARPGDPVVVSHSAIGASDAVLLAHVQANDVVRVVLRNLSAGALDVLSGQLRIDVFHH